MDTGSRKKKILIVDDETALASIYKQAFEIQNCEVGYCENGELALQTAREFHPDAILLDIMMPRLNGLDALDLFRGTPETSNAIIIIMSAIGDAETIKKAKSLGAQDYIVKSNASLNEVVERVLALLSQVKEDLDPATLGDQAQPSGSGTPT
jgi:DNA-binding response OmpR family regulator